MVERETKGDARTPDETIQSLLVFLKDAEFGTAKYLALGDFLQLRRLEDDRMMLYRSERIESSNTIDKLSWESDMRVQELEIAILETDVLKKKTTVKGYLSAFDTLRETSEVYGYQVVLSVGITKDNESKRDEMHGKYWDALWEEYKKRNV